MLNPLTPGYGELQSSGPVRSMRAVTTFFVLLAFALVQGCSTWQPARYNDSLATQVAVGDLVRIEMRDGSREQFEITAVDSAGVYDETAFYAFAEISELAIRGTSPEATAGGMVVVSVVLGVAAILLLINKSLDETSDALFD